MCSNDEPIEFTIEPEKTKIYDLAKLYVDELKKQFIIQIEPTEIIKQSEVTPEGITFSFNCKSYSAAKYRAPNKLVSEVLKESDLNDRESVTIESTLLDVYRVNEWYLHSKIKMFPRKDPMGNEHPSVVASTISGFVGFVK